jgi:hypothetical protein
MSKLRHGEQVGCYAELREALAAAQAPSSESAARSLCCALSGPTHVVGLGAGADLLTALLAYSRALRGARE